MTTPTWEDRFESFGMDLCPICGIEVYIKGETTDGRLIGSCQDAFTYDQWNSGEYDED